MRWGMVVISILLILMGAVWVAQGTGVLPVGGMANVIKWAYYGSGLIVLGLALLALSYRRRR
jgi:hypothetical protein